MFKNSQTINTVMLWTQVLIVKYLFNRLKEAVVEFNRRVSQFRSFWSFTDIDIKKHSIFLKKRICIVLAYWSMLKTLMT